MNRLLAFTLTWNGEEKLKKLAPSLVGAFSLVKDIIEPKWMVRDNGSVDNSIKYLRENYQGDMEIYSPGHNRDSFAAGMNSLAKLSKPSDDDLILLLNNDVIIHDHSSIRKMVELMYSANADVVGARLLFTNTTKLQHAGVIFSHKYGDLPYHYRPGDESDKAAEKNRWFQAVTAAVCIVRGSAFNRIGGMDEGYRWAFEDIDMCLSIGKTGGKIAYCGATSIYHEESASLKKNPVHKMFMKPNVDHFKSKWSGKYEIDHDKYLSNPGYKEIKV